MAAKASHHMSTNLRKLMNPSQSPDNSPIINSNVTCERCIVCEDSMMTDVAIMRNMHISHYPIIISNAGYTLILRCP